MNFEVPPPRFGLAPLVVERARAQRWHDTDHGDQRGKPLTSNQFRIAVPERQPEYVSACWCCCQICDRDANPSGRWNPYWSRAA